MTLATAIRKSWNDGAAAPLIIAVVVLCVHLYTNAFAGYGYFRDELYYIACTEHLDIGYVDQPPLSIYILAVNRWLFGDSLFALRLIPAVIGALLVLLTSRMARELGGGKTAAMLAAMGTAAAPIALGMLGIFSMNSIDYLAWSLFILAAIRLLKTESPRCWLLLGLALGVGALNKIGILWIGAGFAAGLLFTPARRWYRTPWPYIAGGIAFLCFLPFIIWNINHDFAHLEFIRNATSGKYSGLSPLAFVTGQILLQNPFALPLWGAGLIVLLVWTPLKQYRALGFAYLTAFAILTLNWHSKAEYLSAAYPMLFAAGGVALEHFTARGSHRRWMVPAYMSLLAISAIAFAPLAIPILPVETYIAYAERVGMAPSTAENKKLERLPQFYADMFGWPEKAAAVAQAFYRLKPEEQARCAIFADNYGRCGALDFFGNHYGLPRSIGRHNSYWVWGPGDYTGELVLVLGGDLEDKQQKFTRVDIVGTVDAPYSLPYENHLNIYLCRGLRTSLPQVWKSMRHFD
jgi:4-amino-4-deoxy-L-arabinose transferase-like glycosyltransferase